MTESKNRELAISATSKIYEKVNDALRKRDTDKRWFWELLQNAKDTVVFKKGETTQLNDPNKKVDVKLTLTKNEKKNDQTTNQKIDTHTHTHRKNIKLNRIGT